MSQNQVYASPPPAGARQALDNTTDLYTRSCGGLLLALTVTGLIMIALCIKSCDFIYYEIPTEASFPPFPSPGNDDLVGDVAADINTQSPTDLLVFTPPPSIRLSTRPSASPSQDPTYSPTTSPTPEPLTRITFGLFYYQDHRLPKDAACVEYPAKTSDEEWMVRIARLCIVVAFGGAFLAGLFLMIEYVFCRFYCSRFLINSSMVLAVVALPLTFAALLGDHECQPFKRTGNSTFADDDLPGINSKTDCHLGQGATFVLVGTVLLFLALILTCVTPKSVPLIRMADRIEWNKRRGICCCRTRKKRQGPKQDEGGLELPDSSSGLSGMIITDPSSPGSQQVCYKPYHDETAGMTFQNQYTAAYKRWLACEADYEEALGRFKSECAEADVDWRQFLQKAKARRLDSFVDECNTGQEENDDMFLDDELLRFSDVLSTLQDSCSFAKEVMSRIQHDINEHTQSEDDRKTKGSKPSSYTTSRKNSSSSEAEAQTKFNDRLSTSEEDEFYSTAALDMEQSPFLTTIDHDGDKFASARMELFPDNVLMMSSAQTSKFSSNETTKAPKRDQSPMKTIFHGIRAPLDWSWKKVSKRRQRERPEDELGHE